MHQTCNMRKEESNTKVCQKFYRGMIGFLLYLTTFILDILYNDSLCAIFQLYLRYTHLNVVKKIFRYLKGTTNLGLQYKKSLDYKLLGLCESDFDGDKIERKSTSGSCNSQVKTLYHDPVKDKSLFLYLQQKLNTYQLQVIAPNYSG